MRSVLFSRVLVSLSVGFLVCTLVGCGGGDKVSGTVQFEDGTKLTSGEVSFSGGDVQEIGKIDEDGNYELMEGLPEGEYTVTVTAYAESSDDEGDSESAESTLLVDVKFTDPGTTPLKYTSPGEGTYDIKVQKAPAGSNE